MALMYCQRRVERQLRAGQKTTQRRVLCGTLCDFCERRLELLPVQGRTITTIAEYQALHWLLLTKRPENLSVILSDLTVRGYDAAMYWAEQPPEHVWLGVSVEDQTWADRRIPLLLDAPARHRFVVCEPLLGPISVARWADRIEWVVIGVETGYKARPAHIDWVAELVAECHGNGIPVFVQHLGMLVTTDIGMKLVVYRELPMLLR